MNGQQTPAYETTVADQPYHQHFEGRFALVTGGTQGLGLATAELLIRRGISGVLLCGRNVQAGEAAAKRLSESGAQVHFQAADLSQIEDVSRVFERATELFGYVDILVNSAGTTERASILDADPCVWDRTFDINARAPFFLMQHFAKALIAKGLPGHVVNIASIIAHGGTPDLCVYAASKAALTTLTRNAAFALSRHRVRVNALAIGWMNSDGEQALRRDFYKEAEGWQEREGQQLPAGRLLSPNEVARWIAHLACAESGIMTGSVLDLDHGVAGMYETTPLPAALG